MEKFRRYFVYNFIAGLLETALPIIFIFLPKLLVEQFQDHMRINSMLITVLIFGLIIAIARILISFFSQQSQIEVDRFNRYFEEKHKQKCANMEFEKTEDSEILNLSQKAQNGLSWYGGIDNFMRQISNIISYSIQIITKVIILFTDSYWIVLLSLLTIIIRFIVTIEQSRVEFKLNNDFAVLDRRLNYNFWQVYDFKYGKDIRLYNADEMIDQNCKEIAEEYYNLDLKCRKK